MSDAIEDAKILEVDGIPVTDVTLDFEGVTYVLLENGIVEGRTRWRTADEVVTISYVPSVDYWLLDITGVGQAISNDSPNTPEFPWQATSWTLGEGVTTQPVFTVPSARTTRRLIRDVSTLSNTELYLFDRAFIKIITARNLAAAIDDYRTEVLDALMAGPTGIDLLEAITTQQANEVLGITWLAPTSQVNVTSSTTLVNVPGMSFAVAANTTYMVTIHGRLNTGAGGHDMRLSVPSLQGSASATHGFGYRVNNAGAINSVQQITTTSLRVLANGSPQVAPDTCYFMFRTAGTGGTAQFQFAQFASNAATSSLLTSTRARIEICPI